MLQYNWLIGFDIAAFNAEFGPLHPSIEKI